jgi:hypothetical protein
MSFWTVDCGREADLWLNVPRPTSCPEIRTSTPSSISEPKAIAFRVINKHLQEVSDRTCLRSSPVQCFPLFDIFDTTLDMALQPRMYFLYVRFSVR